MPGVCAYLPNQVNYNTRGFRTGTLPARATPNEVYVTKSRIYKFSLLIGGRSHFSSVMRRAVTCPPASITYR